TTVDPGVKYVDVLGLSSGVAFVSAGPTHTCAITTAGALKCWGANEEGEIGINTTSASVPTPTDVIGLSSGVVAVSARAQQDTCALLTGGAVKCWGLNQDGMLGTGSSSPSALFQPPNYTVVGLMSGVIDLSAGDTHVCVVGGPPAFPFA